MIHLTEGRWRLPVWLNDNYLEVPADGPWARLYGSGCPPEGKPLFIFECEKHIDWMRVPT